MNDRNEGWRQGSYKESLLDGVDKNTVDSSGGEIVRTLELLFVPDAVVELRAFKGPVTSYTVAGFPWTSTR